MKHSIKMGMVTVMCILDIFLFAQAGNISQDAVQAPPQDAPATSQEPGGAYIGNYDNDNRFTVSYKRNKPHGVYQSWYAGMAPRDEGKFRLGIPDGKWQGWYSNGKPRFIRTYSADKFARIRQEVKKHPRQVFTPLATAAQADPAALKAATAGNQSFQDLYGRKPEEIAPVPLDSDIVATIQFNEAAGDRAYLPPFSTCLHHGLYMNFYPNGAVKDSGYYKNGLREGHWEEWVASGNIRSFGRYIHGRKTGTWSFYDNSGRLRSLITYNRKGIAEHQKFYE